MTTPRRPVALLSALMLGALSAAVLQYSTREDCPTVDAYSVSVADVDALIADGWAGSPSDGTEQLYAPECLPVDATVVTY